MKRYLYSCLGATLLLAAAVGAQAVVINEIRIDQVGTDTDEYFELSGTPNQSLTGLTYIVLGDSPSGLSGVIESVTDLTGQTIKADGYLALVRTADVPVCTGYDGTAAITFENSDNVTHMLVTGFTGSLLQDLDTNDDGVLDVTPWTSIVDCVGVVGPNPPNPAAGIEYVYCTTHVGPDGSFVPSHILRCPDSTGPWAMGSFDVVCTFDTPGAANNCSNLPPTIQSVHSTPCAPAAAQSVNVLADVTDPNNNVTSVRVYYKLEAAALYDSVAATLTTGSTYQATLPGQIDQSRVVYYIGARDATGNFIRYPNGAPTTSTRDYRVGIQTIASIQSSTVADSCLTSTFKGKAVNVVGVVTHKKFEYSDNFFYVQSGVGPYSGIKIFGSDSTFVPELGDSVRASGYIDEFNCQTEVVLFSDCASILGHNRKVRARQLTQVSDIQQEQNESMLVTVQGPITVATANDSTNLGKEFKIGSGTNIAYVGDDTFFPDGIGYTIVPQPGMILDAITGIVGYRRTNTTPAPRANPEIVLRLEPRRDNDVDRDFTDTGDDGVDVVKAFGLRQNSPNPFNPLTTISFSLPQAGHAELSIFDASGRLVRHLLSRNYDHAANERVIWDGRDDLGKVVSSGLYFYKLDSGSYSATRKMLLLK
jgi:hypothetical protein